MQPSEEIKSKLDIVDFIRDYLPLKQAGMNFTARCPFHQEKTPSFMVSPDKQIWHCFGCSKGGDIFAFVMEMEGIDFKEALRLLAPKAGVVLRKENPQMVSRRNRIMDILELSRRYYHKILMEDVRAGAAREYLKRRGLTDEVIGEWQIGYSPETWDTITGLLLKRGYKEDEIFAAGMSVKSQNRPGYYDRFRGRIMFPINDQNGNTVAFTARVSPEREAEEKMGKYVNSPQTSVYDKSRILFGLDKAKQEIKKRGFVIVVEGQMDVIAVHQHGYRNAVASSSTSLTKEHIDLVKRFTDNIVFALDADSAGQLGVERGDNLIANNRNMTVEGEDKKGVKRIYLEPGSTHGINISLISIPDGKDPDECVRKNPEAWAGAVEKRRPLMEHYFANILSKLDLGRLEDKRKAAGLLLPKIGNLGSRIEQDFWLKTLSERIEIDESILRETFASHMKKTARIPAAKETKRPEAAGKIFREEGLSELLLALTLKFPSLTEYLVNTIQIDQLAGDGNQAIYRNLILFYNNINGEWTGEYDDGGGSRIINYHSFRERLRGPLLPDDSAYAGDNEADNQLKKLDRLALLADREFSGFDEEQARSEAIKIAAILRRNYLAKRMKELEKLILDYERDGDINGADEAMREFKLLADEMRQTGF